MRLDPKLLKIIQSDSTLHCYLEGDWTLRNDSNDVAGKTQELFNKAQNAKNCRFYFKSLQQWDSSLLVFLLQIDDKLNSEGLTVDFSELPQKVQNLISFAKTRSKQNRQLEHDQSDAQILGYKKLSKDFSQIFSFWGKWLLSLLKFLTGRSFLRLTDLLIVCRDCGVSALPIVTLISFLTGLTMAFVGSVQLEKFNATI